MPSLSIIGMLVAGAGWFGLFFLSSVDSYPNRGVINIHKLTIFENVIYLGYFLTLLGYFLKAHGVKLYEPPPLEAAPPIEIKGAGAVITEEQKAIIKSRLEEAFPGVTVAPRDDGSIQVATLTGLRTFRDVQSAIAGLRAK